MRALPDIISDVDKARKDLNELKLKQLTGAKSLSINEVTTNNQWDVDGTFSSSTTQQFKFWFIADHQTAPIASFRPYILVNGLVWNLTTDLVFEEFLSSSQFTGLSDDQLDKAAIYTIILFSQSPLSVSIKIKMRVIANDTGSIGVFIDT